MSTTGTTAPRGPAPALDRSRPFGAHLRMSWWTPLVLLTVPALVMVVLQILLYGLVAVVERGDVPSATALTPLRFLAVNVSIAMSGLVAVLLVSWTTGAPWRSLDRLRDQRHDRRPPGGHRADHPGPGGRGGASAPA